MDLPVISGGTQRIGEREKSCCRRGVLDLCQGGPGVNPGYRGRGSHSPREEARGAPHPGVYPCHPAQDRPKGPGMPSGKTQLHAPRSARGGGPPLPNPAHAESGGVDREWLSPAFPHKLADWKALALQAASWPTHLAEIARREPTHLGFYDVSGLGAGGVWIDPARTGKNLV